MNEAVRYAILGAAIFLALLLLEHRDASAQVPPHAPGTICFTPSFWCWAQQPGPVGAFCGCYTSSGFTPGVLG